MLRLVPPALLAVAVAGCSSLQSTTAVTREVQLRLDVIP